MGDLRSHLGSPFIKATPQNTGSSDPLVVGESTSSGIPIWLYGLIGLLLLIVGLLSGKLLGRKKTLPILLLLSVLATETFGQTLPVERARRVNEETETARRMEELDLEETRRGQINKGIDQLNKAFGTAKAAENLIDKYKNLGSCLSSTPPAGQPKIPSFCEDENDTCASCFLNARKKFNEVRYRLEKLQTIYDCTKAYTDAAISFGEINPLSIGLETA